MNNSITITGNLTRDPVVKQLPSGTVTAQLSIAWTENVPQADGTFVPRTNYFNIDVFAGQVTFARKFRKGDQVTVFGRLRYREWTDQASGQKRSTVDIVANSLAGEATYRNADDLAKIDAMGGMAAYRAHVNQLLGRTVAQPQPAAQPAAQPVAQPAQPMPATPAPAPAAQPVAAAMAEAGLGPAGVPPQDWSDGDIPF